MMLIESIICTSKVILYRSFVTALQWRAIHMTISNGLDLREADRNLPETI
jgi:hypothetical protein